MGRKRYIPELLSDNYSTRLFGERVAMNTPLQGTSADIIKLAMVEVSKRLKESKSYLVLQVHDELVIEAHESEIEQIKIILKDCMENAIELKIPLTVDVASGKSWLDC
jgi:DNA polymerase-1